MWTVNVVSGEAGKRASIRSHKFETKSEALAFIRSMRVSFIRRIEHTYTIYPRPK